MAAVDIAYQLRELVLQIAIGFDRAARRRCDLQQGYRARKRRLQGPHLIKCVDAVDQSFGIVQPIDADRQLLAVQAPPQPRHIGM